MLEQFSLQREARSVHLKGQDETQCPTEQKAAGALSETGRCSVNRSGLSFYF